jgi:hypothetical protein
MSLLIVLPVNAGPFHLGNVGVGTKITVSSHTGAAPVTSTPPPQARDPSGRGVPEHQPTQASPMETPVGGGPAKRF